VSSTVRTRRISSRKFVESRNTERSTGWPACIPASRQHVLPGFPSTGFRCTRPVTPPRISGYPDNLYVLDIEQPVDEIAGYGDIRVHPADRWRLSVGARCSSSTGRRARAGRRLLERCPTDRKSYASGSGVSPRIPSPTRPRTIPPTTPSSPTASGRWPNCSVGCRRLRSRPRGQSAMTRCPRVFVG